MGAPNRRRLERLEGCSAAATAGCLSVWATAIRLSAAQRQANTGRVSVDIIESLSLALM